MLFKVLGRNNKGHASPGQTPASIDLPDTNQHHHGTQRAKRNGSIYEMSQLVEHEGAAMRHGGVWPWQHRRWRNNLAQRLYRYPFPSIDYEQQYRNLI